MPPPPKPLPPKRDIERFGVFKEDGYLRELDYIPLDNFVWNESVHKKKQMLVGTVSAKRKDGTNNGYFSEFARSFEGEAITDPLREYRKERQTKVSFMYAGQFLPSSPGKKWSGSGDFQGTFSHNEAFSPLKRQKIHLNAWKKLKKPLRFKQSMKGGYGSGDITINRFPAPFEPDSLSRPKLNEPLSVDMPFWDYYTKPAGYINKNPYYSHRSIRQQSSEPKIIAIPRFKPTTGVRKEFKPCGAGPTLGGCKAGCFTHYSTYGVIARTNFDRPMRGAKKVKPIAFTSAVANNTGIFRSILQTNVDKQVTCISYKTVDGVMYKKAKRY